MPTIRMHFIRHGESQANKFNLLGRTPESPLSDLGEAQARLLGAVHGPALSQALDAGLVFSSPCKRAQQTAACALEQVQVPQEDAQKQLLLRESLTEIHRGDWDGQVMEGELLKQLREMNAKDPFNWKSPGEDSESRRDVQARVAAWLEDAAAYLRGKGADGEDVTAYVFCHFVVIECVLGHVLRCGEGHGFRPENTSVSTIERPEGAGEWRVKEVNNVRHLQCDPMVAVAPTMAESR